MMGREVIRYRIARQVQPPSSDVSGIVFMGLFYTRAAHEGPRCSTMRVMAVLRARVSTHCLRCAAIGALLFVGSACGANGDAPSAGGTRSCDPRVLQPYNTEAKCFEQGIEVTGLCMITPRGTRTTGVEDICLQDPAGRFFVMVVATDVSVEGEGWQVGGRAAPGLVSSNDVPMTVEQVRLCDEARDAFENGIGPGETHRCAP